MKVYGNSTNRKTKNTYNFFTDELKPYASSDSITKNNHM